MQRQEICGERLQVNPTTQTTGNAPPRQIGRDWAFALTAAAVGLAVSILLWLHVPGVNGPAHWRWWYRDPAVAFLFWFTLATLPILFCVLMPITNSRDTLRAVVVITVAGAMLRAVVVLYLQPALGLGEIDQLVRSDSATSYYYDGVRLIDHANARRAAGESLRHWLALYDEFHSQTSVHTATKPAGGVIYWMAWWEAVGDEHAPLVGALTLMALTSLTPLGVWRIAMRLGVSTQSSILAAALMALSPGFLLTTPSFDAAYPLFTCSLILTWLSAVEHKRLIAICMSALILFIGTLMSLHLLCIGIAVIAAPFVAGRLSAKQIAQRSLAFAPIVVALTIGLYATMALTFGYAPIAVIKSCFINQAEWARQSPQWFTPGASLFNLSDGALGIGWPVAVAFVAAMFSKRCGHGSRQIAWIAAGTIALAAGAHMLPAEVARVWVFITPLVVIPAAVFINQLADRPRALVLLASALTTVATCGTLKFILGSAPAVR